MSAGAVRMLAGAAATLSLLAAGTARAEENLALWNKRMPVTFSGYAPPGGGAPLTNFPALVVFSNSTAGAGFDYADFLSPPYGDLRFAAADKTTPLDFEIESWDTAGLSYVWVKVPELTPDTTIYALWAREGVAAPPCATNGAVWAEGYNAVWHLCDGADNAHVSDSTANRRHGTKKAADSPAQTDAVVGKGQLFASSYIDVTGLADSGKTHTLSMWINGGAGSSAANIFPFDVELGRLVVGWGADPAGKIGLYDGAWRNFGNTPSLNAWHHIAFVCGASTVSLYVDGAPYGSAQSYTSRAIGGKVTLGSRYSYANNFPGMIDEARVASVARSADWIWACWMSQASNGVFNAVGAPEFQDLPFSTNAGGATNATAASAWLNGALVATGTSATAVSVYWGTSDGGTNASDWGAGAHWPAPQAPGDFTVQATGLDADAAYFYRFAASNDAGVVWAEPSSVFITGEVWIEKTADASETGPTPGTFTVYRASGAVGGDLVVAYTVGGTATPGADYVPLGGALLIPAGAASATFAINPLFDHLVEGPETVTVALAPGPYLIGEPGAAGLKIADYGMITRTWCGDGGNGLAGTAANWVEGEAPVAGDAILLDARSSSNMTWNLDIPVHSWMQNGYTGTVTFKTGTPGLGGTTYYACHGAPVAGSDDRELRITEDCTLLSGTWTHEANPYMTSANDGWKSGRGIYRLRVSAGGDFTLGAEASIDATTKGFHPNNGPGQKFTGWGSSHGGVGTAWYGPVLTQNLNEYCYGSVKAPETLGTAVNYNSSVTSGGGAVRIEAGGTLSVTGAVSATGATAGHYVPAGGSIFLKAHAIEGTGTLRANGGTATVSPTHGGGGRVALVLTGAGETFDAFTGAVEAYAGGMVSPPPPSSIYNAGYSGTIYTETVADNGKGVLLVKGIGSLASSYSTHNLAGTILSVPGEDYAFSRVILTNNATLAVASNATLRTGELIAYGYNGSTKHHILKLLGGTLDWTGTEYRPPADYDIRCYLPGSGVRVDGGAGTMVVTNVVTVDAELTVDGSLTAAPGGRIVQTAGASTGTQDSDLGYRTVVAVTGDMTVESGATVDAAGKGFSYSGSGGSGPGRPATANRGGTHGGMAADSAGECYGSLTAPTAYGSGGSSTYSAGGGAIRLTVAGTLAVDGLVDANGKGGQAYPGAGGSIWIAAGALAGSGTIRANGGYTTGSYSGGGGRVAVAVTNEDALVSDFGGTISAYGGVAGSAGTKPLSAAGTLYLRNGGEGETAGTLLVDNGAATAAGGAAEIAGGVTDADVGNVVVTNGSALNIRAGQTLIVRKNWVNAGCLVTGELGSGETAHGTVAFADTNFVSRISGTNAFAGFTCATPGKTLEFGTGGSHLQILAGGLLTLVGAEGNLVTLRPGVPGVHWTMECLGGTDISYVDVSWSDAQAGNTVIVTAPETCVHAETVNWGFVTVTPGETLTWTGEADTDWANPANWVTAALVHRPPAATDDVHIPSVVSGRYPILGASQTLNQLRIDPSASLDLNHFSIAVTNNLRVAGTLTARGGETVDCSGAVNFASGLFACADATLLLSGGAAQQANLGGQTLGAIQVSKTGGSVAWQSGIAADSLTCAAQEAQVALVFQAGAAVSLKHLVLDGTDGAATNLTLASSSPGTAWLLNVSDHVRVTGVAVADSDASGGQEICAEAPSQDNEGNENWKFNVTIAHWIGTGADFHTAGNWSTGEVPDEDTHVRIETAASVILVKTPVTVRSLAVGGGASVATLRSTNAFVVIGNTEVLTNGTWIADWPAVVSNAALVRAGGIVTHTANGAAELYKLNLTVAGNMTIDAGGSVDVQNKGYSANNGPGTATTGATHGGRGAGRTTVCYGSATAPAMLGSGSQSNVGGGAVKLTVGGTLTVNGTILANPKLVSNYTGSGGSVWVTCGTLAGTGEISANGGNLTDGAATDTAGGGGRVAVYQTAATAFSFGGTISAYGGKRGQGSTVRPQASAGTVYLKSAGSAGRVVIANNNGVYSAYMTDFPVSEARFGDPVRTFRDIVFEARESGTVNLMEDAVILDMDLQKGPTAAKTILLNDRVLTIRSLAHKNGVGWNYTSSAGTEGLGRIVWMAAGTILFVF